MEKEPTPSLAAKTNGHGGARSGAGRKRKDHTPSAAQVDYADAHARRISAEATILGVKLREMQAAYVSREAVQDAAREAFDSIRGALLPIPSRIKERVKVSPEVVAEVDKAIREALADLAITMTHTTGAPIATD